MLGVYHRVFIQSRVFLSHGVQYVAQGQSQGQTRAQVGPHTGVKGLQLETSGNVQLYVYMYGVEEW